MLKKISLTGLILFSITSPNYVYALNGSEKIDDLLMEISTLEQDLEERKLELQKLVYGEKSDEIDWLDMNLLTASSFLLEPAYVELVKIGIDYSNDYPELHAVFYTKNVSTEFIAPTRTISSSLTEQTNVGKDYVRAKENYTYLIKDGDSFIEGDKSALNNEVAPGWDGYFRMVYPIENPNAIYELIGESYQNHWSIAISGTDEEFGEILSYSVD